MYTHEDITQYNEQSHKVIQKCILQQQAEDKILFDSIILEYNIEYDLINKIKLEDIKEKLFLVNNQIDNLHHIYPTSYMHEMYNDLFIQRVQYVSELDTENNRINTIVKNLKDKYKNILDKIINIKSVNYSSIGYGFNDNKLNISITNYR
jgi:hypothetical protein